jgi:signal transduction histidine kinase
VRCVEGDLAGELLEPSTLERVRPLDLAGPHRFSWRSSCGGSWPVRFLLSLWLLILSALLLFSFVLFSHELFAPDLSPTGIKLSLLLATWVIGLVSAVSIHLLYRRTKRVMLQAARDETIVQLAGAIAHELNQPLTVVVSSAELISHRDRSLEEVRETAARMAEASQRMADIVAKLQKATCYRTKPYVGKVRIVDLDRAS